MAVLAAAASSSSCVVVVADYNSERTVRQIAQTARTTDCLVHVVAKGEAGCAPYADLAAEYSDGCSVVHQARYNSNGETCALLTANSDYVQACAHFGTGFGQLTRRASACRSSMPLVSRCHLRTACSSAVTRAGIAWLKKAFMVKPE